MPKIAPENRCLVEGCRRQWRHILLVRFSIYKENPDKQLTVGVQSRYCDKHKDEVAVPIVGMLSKTPHVFAEVIS
jgi:hypothetical protein